MKRVISAFLILVMVLSLMPALTMEAKAESVDIKSLVEQQIRAYADSIDQADAVDTAASALAVHGMTMGGKKLIMDEDNALTAVLMNSELVQVGLANIFADTLETMQLLDMQDVPGVQLSFAWYKDKLDYGSYILTGSEESPANLDWMQTADAYTGTLNAYDNSLEWMAGTCEGSAVIRCIEDTGSEKTYHLTVTFNDRFDFSIANTSGFKKLLSGIGMLMFKEFDWSCTVSFELTTTYSYDHCRHSSGFYRWTYDPQNHTMISDGSNGYTRNDATHKTAIGTDGTTVHYYALENTIRLYHNKPWVLEYDVCKPEVISFAPIENAVAKTLPQIMHTTRAHVYVTSKEYAMAQGENGMKDRYYAYHYVGTKLWPQYPYDYDSYVGVNTFRLENIISPDGTNMIYLSAIREDTGEVWMDRVPMDDHSYYGGWMDCAVSISEESTRLNGQDIYINFFGNQRRGFGAESFELRIWENGKEGKAESYIETTAVEPTCISEGYTAHTCTKCGYTEKTDFVAPLPHDYRDEVIAPTCTAEGYTSHTCKTCGYSHNTDIVPMIPHAFANYVSNNDATCAHDGTKTGKCTVCGASDTVADEGTALPHNWKDATCTKAKTCRVCGGAEGDPLGHDLKYYNAKAPTCTELGWDAYEKCRRCSHSTFATIPALGHNYVDGVCQNCGDGDVLLGDVTGDGEVDIFDANVIVAYYNGTADLNAAQQKAADVNGNGEIDIFDANLIVAFYNGTINSF